MRPSAALETSDQERDRFAADVRHGLSHTPRWIPARYFYDELGSALFEAITRLPWYGITRSEQRLLRTRGREILDRVAPLSRLIELGPGSGEKLATLLSGRREDAAHRPRAASETPRTLDVHLVDVSTAALDDATETLATLPALRVVTHRAEFDRGLVEIGRAEHGLGRTLALFLGSNIGNFDPQQADAMLRSIRAALADGDALLLGTDLVKAEGELVLAYDDPLGVTAAFNRNLLVRMNRELGADFDVGAFAHRAVWNAGESRVEMHLVSERRQRVRVRAAGLSIDLEAGETLWTESSHKYDADGVRAMLARAGFHARDQWKEGTFALTLAMAGRETA